MSRLHHTLTALLDYVFVNNHTGCSTHTNGALYLGPRCVFLRAQIHKIIGNTLSKKAGWGTFTDGQVWTSVASGSGSIHKTVAYYRLLAASIYISGIAVPVAYGVAPDAAGMAMRWSAQS